MTDATLIADLVRAGVGADLIGRVANALLNVRDNVRDKAVKEHERERKRKWRETTAAVANNGGAQANDGARAGANPVPQNVPDIIVARSPLTSFLSSTEVVTGEGSKEKKERLENARARGTRMQPGAPLTEESRQAALKLGAPPQFVDEMWVEHVDYWVAVPGQRGVKTDWLATWRNDVRRKLKMGTYTGQKAPNVAENRSLIAAARRASERVAGALGLGDQPSEPVFRIVSQG